MSRIIIEPAGGGSPLEVDRDVWANGFFPGYVYVEDAAGQPGSGALTILAEDIDQILADPTSAPATRLRAAYGILLGRALLNPSAFVSLSTTSTVSADVHPNLHIAFKAPDTGEVDVTMQGYADVSAAGINYLWHVRDANGMIPGTEGVATRVASAGTAITYTATVTGLTPGQSYTWSWGHRLGAAGTGRILAGSPYGPARMAVGKA